MTEHLSLRPKPERCTHQKRKTWSMSCSKQPQRAAARTPPPALLLPSSLVKEQNPGPKTRKRPAPKERLADEAVSNRTPRRRQPAFAKKLESSLQCSSGTSSIRPSKTRPGQRSSPRSNRRTSQETSTNSQDLPPEEPQVPQINPRTLRAHGSGRRRVTSSPVPAQPRPLRASLPGPVAA